MESSKTLTAGQFGLLVLALGYTSSMIHMVSTGPFVDGLDHLMCIGWWWSVLVGSLATAPVGQIMGWIVKASREQDRDIPFQITWVFPLWSIPISVASLGFATYMFWKTILA